MIYDLECDDLEMISISKGNSENTLIFRNNFGAGVLSSMYYLESNVSSGDVSGSHNDMKPKMLEP